MKKPSTTSVILAIALLWTAATRPAFAYLDPGTGSMIFQVALASLFGLLIAIKTFWGQIKLFIDTKVLHKQADIEAAPLKSKKVKS